MLARQMTAGPLFLLPPATTCIPVDAWQGVVEAGPVAARWKLHTVKVVCLRSLKGRFDAGRSLLLRVDLPDVDAGDRMSAGGPAQLPKHEEAKEGKACLHRGLVG